MSRGKFAEFDCKISFQKEIDVGKYYIPINNVYKEKDTKYDLIGATFVYDFHRDMDMEVTLLHYVKLIIMVIIFNLMIKMQKNLI